MNDIEELMWKQLKDAEQQPPEGTWEEIAQRLDAAGPATNTGASERHSHLRHSVWIAAAATTAVLVAAVAIYFAVSTPSEVTAAQQTSMLQNPESQIVPVAVDSVVDEEKPVPAVAVHSEQAQQTALQANATQAPVAVATKEPATATQSRRLPPDYVFPSELFDFDTSEWVKDDEETPLAAKTTVAENKKDKPVTAPVKKEERKKAPYIDIPNYLTPNGDGINDCWVIPDLAKCGKTQVNIYTARGNRVYSSNDYKNDFCGAGLPYGNYFYEMLFRDYNDVRRGVLVIKQ